MHAILDQINIKIHSITILLSVTKPQTDLYLAISQIFTDLYLVWNQAAHNREIPPIFNQLTLVIGQEARQITSFHRLSILPPKLIVWAAAGHVIRDHRLLLLCTTSSSGLSSAEVQVFTYPARLAGLLMALPPDWLALCLSKWTSARPPWASRFGECDNHHRPAPKCLPFSIKWEHSPSLSVLMRIIMWYNRSSVNGPLLALSIQICVWAVAKYQQRCWDAVVFVLQCSSAFWC